MHPLNEGLKPNDLKDLIKPIFEIDTFRSKMGEDEDVVVVSFEVTGNDPAIDLVNFIEKGYDFVLDADVSSGEVGKNTYKVFVEIQRDRKISAQIDDIVYGINQLADIKEWRFRYYRDTKTHELTDLNKIVPTTPEAYKQKMDSVFESDMKFFFRKSPLDYMDLAENMITFKRSYNSPIRMELLNYGTRTDILNDLAGTIRIDETSTSETMWLTKYFGDYNITKYGDDFVFENDNSVLVLKLIK
jgi:hypothetical protein